LYEFTQKEASLVWTFREVVKDKPHGLVRILQSVPWTDRFAAQEAYR
jgi:hypothetical protein